MRVHRQRLSLVLRQGLEIHIASLFLALLCLCLPSSRQHTITDEVRSTCYALRVSKVNSASSSLCFVLTLERGRLLWSLKIMTINNAYSNIVSRLKWWLSLILFESFTSKILWTCQELIKFKILRYYIYVSKVSLQNRCCIAFYVASILHGFLTLIIIHVHHKVILHTKNISKEN